MSSQEPRTPGPAQERWARAVVAALDSPQDPRTVALWARLAGASESTLRACCQRARSRAKASLDLARVLRALRKASVQPMEPLDALDVSDPRTLDCLLRKAGLAGLPATLWCARQVLARQRFAVVLALARALEVQLPPDWPG
jgi:hypothetical protein